MEIEQIYEIYRRSRIVTTDSRQVKLGSIFFGLRGEKYDGNEYVGQALENGAVLCIVDKAEACKGERCVLVKDTLEVLQELARYHRSQIDIPVIGITGTNGKTTTKELVREVLSKRYKTHSTQGNLNNHIGVPLTLLSMPEDTEIMVVEMGANHPFEIDFLCKIANPNYGLITNVGRAHLEGFGSYKGVVKTKCELYHHLAAMAGTIFVNNSDNILLEQAEKMSVLPASPTVLQGIVPAFPTVTPADYDKDLKPRGVNMPMAAVVTYGEGAWATYGGHKIESQPYLRFAFSVEDGECEVETCLVGGYNFANAMAAAAIGLYFQVDAKDIRDAIAGYEPTNNRSQYKQTEHNKLIMDCYNANPTSMEVSIKNFQELKEEKKVVILGEMRELGKGSGKEHRMLLAKTKEMNPASIMLIGEEFKFAEGEKGIHWFASAEDAQIYLKNNEIKGAAILIKGSNANRLWTLESYL